MKLKNEQIEKISSIILDSLKRKELIAFKADEKMVLDRIIAIFLDNLRVEDDLDREVEKLIETHSRELEKGDINYRKLFRMIKSKLARERGFVL